MPQGLNRRHVLGGLSLGTLAAAAGRAVAQEARELGWDDLIPEGVPYSQIIDEGRRDEKLDIWLPVFDEYATRIVAELDGQLVKLPGFVIPLQMSGDGVKTFILAPYAGACIHVPPPPANQLVYVTMATPYPSQGLFDPVWVTGTMRTQASMTELAQIGYAMEADLVEYHEWS